MVFLNNPALAAFGAKLVTELVLAEVLVRRLATGFELRHAGDRETPLNNLRILTVAELRALANHTEGGEFRPIKAAPNLRSGWRCEAASEADLESALNQLYPGAIADWFAAQQPSPPVTHYRPFTARQTGMYRITTMLTDAQAARTIRACCATRFCLKRRFWTVDGLPPDSAAGKSLIPCLEPCAVMLEFARKAVRLEQEEHPIAVSLAPSELTALLATLEAAVAHPPPGQRAGDLSAPDNPRRLQLLWEKLQGFAPVAPEAGAE